MKKRESGFFESLGKSIDYSFHEANEDISTGFQQIRNGVHKIVLNEEKVVDTQLSKTDALKFLKKCLMSRLEDVATPAGDDFSYTTILRWVKENHIGKQLVMVKHLNEKNHNVYLFVFFAEGNKLYFGAEFPLICYIMKRIPSSISDLFNGKDVFLQKFV